MRQRLGLSVTTAAVVASGVLTAAVLTDPTVAVPASPGSAPTAPPPRLKLPDEANGRAAIRMLGPQIAEAARLNRMSTTKLRELLLGDRTAWVATTGRLHYRDLVPEGVQRVSSGADGGPSGASGTATVQEASTALATPYALDQTFELHSRPGSARTIFLDFDGHTVSGTYWNTEYAVAERTHPAWTLDADPTTFNRSERAAVQSIWQRVAEDFATFDVDVTTQDPGAAEIDRTGPDDLLFGARALVSPSAQAAQAICGGGCGGVAFLGVYDVAWSHGLYQPAWVFPQHLGHDTKSIAEAISHEVGHHLALEHDGRGTQAYYAGQGIWAPIMGNSYDRPLSQWSRGQYAGATNPQDDLAVIADNGLSARPDEAGGTVGTAALEPPSGSAQITSDADVDVYSLSTCSGPLTLTATAAATSPNLDIEVRLLRQDGSVVKRADPGSAAGDPGWDVSLGMGASLSTDVGPGRYFAAVDGVGHGDVTTDGYDGYGSVGSYDLDVAGACADPAAGTLPAPAPVTAEPAPDGRSVDLQWSAVAGLDIAATTGYLLGSTPDGRQEQVPATTTGYRWTGVSPGAAYTFSVAAVNGIGTGTPATVTVTTPDRPEAPGIGQATSGSRGGRVTATARWAADPSAASSAVDGYRVLALQLDSGGRVVSRTASGLVPAGDRRLSMSLRKGRYAFVVQAHNAVGYSASSARSAVVRAR